MSRPSVRRALSRAGLAPAPRAPRPAQRANRGVVPPPRIFLPGESEKAGLLDLAALFGRAAPVEVEIGVGKGRFLLEAAARHPERSYLGIELQPQYARIAQAKAERLGLTNIRILPLDGKAFVERRLPPSSLAAIHVYFPDPWPKKRHHKRRLFDAAFVAAAARALAPSALLKAASDHAGYFDVMKAVLDAEPALERVSAEETGDWTTGTNYEVKFARSGKPIGKGVWRRKP